ncbi:MAG TPA: 50S ribosomal protein L28 [Candidatus Bathyarchaeia archaeon]|nr:50S ribosomal protein L28 [Candidatus Bathyarchaeia archaeon]
MRSRICEYCGKGILRGHKVSHAKQRTKRILKPNLHWQKVVYKGVSKKMLLCVKCTRFLKKKAKEGKKKD